MSLTESAIEKANEITSLYVGDARKRRWSSGDSIRLTGWIHFTEVKEGGDNNRGVGGAASTPLGFLFGSLVGSRRRGVNRGSFCDRSGGFVGIAEAGNGRGGDCAIADGMAYMCWLALESCLNHYQRCLDVGISTCEKVLLELI